MFLALTFSTFIISLVFALTAANVAHAGTLPITQISSDPFHNPTSQHMTEVEPGSFAFGTTVVSVFQQGRFFTLGSSDIGFATSTDRGRTFAHHGSLPNTVFAGGSYERATVPNVVFDAKHHAWLIVSLGIRGTTVADVIVNRSIDGGLTWSKPVLVKAGNFDSPSITCDNTPRSPFYGNCYVVFDSLPNNSIFMSTSTYGGLTWGAPKQPANRDFGFGGQPLVQPNGRVIVSILCFTTSLNQPFIMKSFISTNGGKSWSATMPISTAPRRVPEGGLRPDFNFPSAAIDQSGKVYVVWFDCRFEKGCFANDLVLSTSTDGIHWTAPTRIPIDPVGSGVDHFIPGLAVDSSTSGNSARLALAYYYYTFANCQTGGGDACELNVGFISSVNGGASWSKSQQLAGPMTLTWLPLTSQGFMVGNHISTSIVPGSQFATPLFAVATAPTGNGIKGQTCIAGAVCHEAIFTTAAPIVGGSISVGNDPRNPATDPRRGQQSGKSPIAAR